MINPIKLALGAMAVLAFAAVPAKAVEVVYENDHPHYWHHHHHHHYYDRDVVVVEHPRRHYYHRDYIDGRTTIAIGGHRHHRYYYDRD